MVKRLAGLVFDCQWLLQSTREACPHFFPLFVESQLLGLIQPNVLHLVLGPTLAHLLIVLFAINGRHVEYFFVSLPQTPIMGLLKYDSPFLSPDNPSPFSDQYFYFWQEMEIGKYITGNLQNTNK